MTDFTSLALPAPLQQALAALSYQTMTPVQAQSLPTVLAGRDLIAQAPTGSGKTVAFALGLLNRLDPTLIRAQALVLCPTRELADQVQFELRAALGEVEVGEVDPHDVGPGGGLVDVPLVGEVEHHLPDGL